MPIAMSFNERPLKPTSQGSLNSVGRHSNYYSKAVKSEEKWVLRGSTQSRFPGSPRRSRRI